MMQKLLLAVGIALLGCAVVAAVLYAWHGHWFPVVLAIGAAFAGKLVLGLVEIVLTPLSFPAAHFARRGNMALSFLFAALLALLGRTAFAAYCAFILLYYFHTPGPPAWLAVALAIVVASAPFAQASRHAPDDTHPGHFDMLAAMFGVAISGALLIFGVGTIPGLAPLALLFLVSAAGFVIWWMSRGARLARIAYLANGGLP
ncbi:MAG: hypothetical protein LCH59_05195 [Proteobacteria bacterium]|jgi:hypothetical protein|nr:hypothetical protein [Pseudomonadota bacterium]HRF83061.1 hypothetical protein [Pseudoxanthomonas sp.]